MSLKLEELRDTVVIKMLGIGSQESYLCKFIPEQNVRFINQPYYSEGIFKDIKQLFKQAKSIRGEQPTSLEQHERIYSLMSTLREYLLNPDFTSIYLAAVSHASIISHIALVKLMTNPDLYPLIKQKLHIYTIGSPRYLPAGLLDKHRLLNFYHTKDPYLPILNFFKCFKTPTIPKFKGPVLYNEEKAIVLTNIPSKDKGSRIKLYHASIDILEPILDENIRYYLKVMQEARNPKYSFKGKFYLCPSS